MHRFIVFGILFVLCFIGLSAQENVSWRLKLDTLEVQGKRIQRPEGANVGTRTSTVSKTILEGNQTKSLSELLSDNSMVYIKSLGQGALATSSFRGTSSTHTRVNWNGININPPMSGSFDFSQIPVFFTDNVVLYHGNSYLGNGTGALGGSIDLGNQPDWNDRTKGRAFAEYGSYDTYTGGISARFVRKKAIYHTRLYYQESENDYKYLNKVLKKDDFYEHRKEAAYKQAGFMQEAYFRPNEYSSVSANIWVQYGDRRLPQPIIVNVTQHEKQEDFSLKYYMGYDWAKGKHRFEAKSAFLLNTLQYDKWYSNDYFSNDENFNRSRTLHLSAAYNYTFSSRLILSASATYVNDGIDASSYSADGATRDVFSFQGSIRWSPFSFLTLNAQGMGEVNDGRFAPTYSGGAAISLVPGLLTLKGNAAYNYKYPGLNDLYWEPGGNPDLQPEKGVSCDGTLTLECPIGLSSSLKAEATYYWMNIDDWIMWLPTSNWFWEPRNVQNVLSHGLELLTEYEYEITDFRLKVGLNYTYSPSVNRERNFEEDATYRCQLPYIPKHKANARLAVDYKNASLTWQTAYTGVRYTTADESYETTDYTIHHLTVGYSFRFKNGCKLSPKVRIDNIANAYYESTQYYPMPLRSFSGSLLFVF